ncbi:carbohydrate ABC transporter permease [Paenibacillus thalictri]|uniref:Carbohydrate ABC transporter permease n=1 Tax=Paenibacillus thalictri TaxID=2527873 RepID=A0A4Q9DJ85_9BACL|nr:carbohydrate ABC transporter permease [Paenibacillus thalictri]TBL72394.1 carbohydrate ABC transporter permease [Paenibacillus thalictri]
MTERSKWANADFWFSIVLYILITCITLFVLLPLLNVLSSSFSSPYLVAQGHIWFWPQALTLQSYGKVFENASVWIGYRNTLLYTALGTSINVILTVLAAYPLSRSDLRGGKAILGLLIFTMYFQGGIIPTYLVVKQLGMVNTVWAMVLPGAINTFNLIVMRTYFMSTLPKELQESAFIDGCTNVRYLWSIVLPVCKPILAVIALYYSVHHWNDFFQALIYLSDAKRYPLQLVLRDILISSKVDDFATLDNGFTDRLFQAEGIKYAMIVVASLPMLVLYPFLQRYFVKGALVGSVKG